MARAGREKKQPCFYQAKNQVFCVHHSICSTSSTAANYLEAVNGKRNEFGGWLQKAEGREASLPEPWQSMRKVRGEMRDPVTRQTLGRRLCHNAHKASWGLRDQIEDRKLNPLVLLSIFYLFSFIVLRQSLTMYLRVSRNSLCRSRWP